MASPGKKSFPLRVDPALWAGVVRLAEQEMRSVNSQVEFLLREALEKRGLLACGKQATSRTGSNKKAA